MKNCLDHYQLVDFAKNRMDPWEYCKWEIHLEECPLCREAVDCARMVNDMLNFYRDLDEIKRTVLNIL